MAQLTLQSLKESGSFVAEPYVPREISWTNTEGETVTADVYVRRASYHTVTAGWKAASESQDFLAGRIAALICDAEGAPVFTVGDLLGTANEENGPICGELFTVLLNVINEVNGVAPGGKKKTPRKISGSN